MKGRRDLLGSVLSAYTAGTGLLKRPGRSGFPGGPAPWAPEHDTDLQKMPRMVFTSDSSGSS